METTALILILALAAFIIFKKMPLTKIDAKSKAIKKSEIIDGYKKQIDTLNFRFKDDLETLKIEKMKLLKTINAELSQNIFFDADELKQTIQELTSYSFR